MTLEELEAIAAKATPGPWSVIRVCDNHHNAVFVAAAWIMVPELIKRVRELLERVRELEAENVALRKTITVRR